MAEPSRARRYGGGLLALATVVCFLGVLGALTLRATATATGTRRPHPATPTLIVRRVVYRTTVVEEILPTGGGGGGTSVSTVSRSAPAISAPAPVAAAAPVTRTS